MNYITEYDARWPQLFARIVAQLHAELSDELRIHHVGSTSVPGMPGKDIVDLDIECPIGSMGELIQRLAAIGYEHEGDIGIEGREAFRPRAGSNAAMLPRHHLYACESGAAELGRHLAFRDYLLGHRDRALWLADQKRIADAAATSRQNYIDRKSAAYLLIAAEALAWTTCCAPNQIGT